MLKNKVMANKIELLNISGSNVINEIVSYNTNKGNELSIYKIIDSNIVEALYNSGYKNFMRTYRFWDILSSVKLKDILGSYLNEIDNSNKFKLIYSNK